MKCYRYLALCLIAALLASCASRGQRAPVYDRAEAEKIEAAAAEKSQGASGKRAKDWRPDSYVVQKGDTLFSIAFNYGFDYHELAQLNNISDPSIISIGQVIQLFPGKTPSTGAGGIGAGATAAADLPKGQPKVVKYAYSEAAMAQIEKVQEQKFTPVVVSKAESNLQSTVAATDDSGDEAEELKLEWSAPTQGKLLSGFSESANRKGVDIAGELGQPILASAAGKVVYSGSGLRGYGKLIIIKHNKTYLSAYAHNDKVLVKEGQSVTRGQKIAAMGKTDADRVKLHFEVRRLGKPVDPAKYIPLGKS